MFLNRIILELEAISSFLEILRFYSDSTVGKAMPQPFDPYYQWLGIPPEEQPPNHYRLLGIKWFEENADVISAAVDRQVLHLRTYQIGEYSDYSQRLLGEVISAKICLLDPKKKAVYDQKLLEGDLQKSIDQQKNGQNPAFGPRLEALFDEAETAEPSKLLHRPKKKLRLPSRRSLVVLCAIGGGLLLLGVLVTAGRWLADSVAVRLGGDGEAVESVSSQPPVPPAMGNAEAEQAAGGEETELPQKTSPPEAKAALPAQAEPKQPQARETPVAKTENETGFSWQSPPLQPGERASPAVAAPPAGSRLPIPAAEDRRRAWQMLDERYHINATNSPIEKIRLAKHLLRSKRGLIAGPEAAAFDYEMLEQASRLAAESGNFMLSLAAIDEIAARFEIDPLAAKYACLLEAANTVEGPAAMQQLSIAADKLVGEALEQKRFNIAERILDTAISAFKGAAGNEFRRQFIERRKQIHRQRQQDEGVAKAERTLKQLPNDGPANLLLGMHYCFAEDDWQQGLPYLAKGDDEDLARLANLELDNPPQSTAEEIQMGDAWWQLATARFGPSKKPILLRAAHWYRRAQFKVITPQQAKHVDTRLEAIVRLTGPEAK